MHFLFQFVLLHFCVHHLLLLPASSFSTSSSSITSPPVAACLLCLHVFLSLLFTYFSFLVGNDSGLLSAAASPCATTAPCCHAAHAGWFQYNKIICILSLSCCIYNMQCATYPCITVTLKDTVHHTTLVQHNILLYVYIITFLFIFFIFSWLHCCIGNGLALPPVAAASSPPLQHDSFKPKKKKYVTVRLRETGGTGIIHILDMCMDDTIVELQYAIEDETNVPPRFQHACL